MSDENCQYSAPRRQCAQLLDHAYSKYWCNGMPALPPPHMGAQSSMGRVVLRMKLSTTC